MRPEYSQSGQYRALVPPKTAYAGMTADTPCLGVANVLLVAAKAKASLVTAVLDEMFKNLDAIHKIHAEARKLTLATAATVTAVPFHMAAEAYYKARGVL